MMDTPGTRSGRWLALFVVVSGLGALNGWTLLVGELTRTMALNGVLPEVFTRNNRRGAPVLALLVTSALASIMVVLTLLAVALAFGVYRLALRRAAQPASSALRDLSALQA